MTDNITAADTLVRPENTDLQDDNEQESQVPQDRVEFDPRPGPDGAPARHSLNRRRPMFRS